MSEDNNEDNVVRIEDFFSSPTVADDFDSILGDQIEVYVDKPWWLDNYEMHDKFGFHEAVGAMTPEMLRKMLAFRLNFLQEELDEAKNAVSAEDVVDAMIDLCVVAIGTLDAYDIDAQTAWDKVQRRCSGSLESSPCSKHG